MVTIDGHVRTIVFQSAPTGSVSVVYSASLTGLGAGTHTYVISVTSELGFTSKLTGTVSVPGPAISSVAVNALTGRISWKAVDTYGVASTKVTIDGTPGRDVNQPSPSGSVIVVSSAGFSAYAGSHSYVITATDEFGYASQFTGTFSVW
jgi:hypothetical protein